MTGSDVKSAYSHGPKKTEISMTRFALSRTRRALVVVSLAVVATVSLLGASNASAAFGITAFGGAVISEDGSSATLAGAHPYAAVTSFTLNQTGGVPDDQLKDAVVDLPPGLVGNPAAVPQCLMADFLDSLRSCPLSSIVGRVVIDSPILARTTSNSRPIYNLSPPDSSPARFAFKVSDSPVYLDVGIRPGDFGVVVRAENSSTTVPVRGVKVTLWGVPADPSHDAQRCRYGFGPPAADPPVCPGEPNEIEFGPNRAGTPPVAFLTDPASCTQTPMKTTLTVTSWQNPTVTQGASFDEDLNGNPITVDRCGEVPFEPSVAVAPSSSAAGSPTGLDVHLTLPQEGLLDPVGRAPSPIKAVTVALPAGMTINASSADGLASCSPAQIALLSSAPPTCPEAAKIGSAQVITPLLSEPLSGTIYLARQNDNPFNSTFALYLVVEGPGIVLKLPGKIDPDPQTGRLTATFDDNPQLPVADLTLHLKGGEHASLVTPSACGTYTTHTELTPWARPTEPVSSDSSFTIDQNCGKSSQFAPGFEAGTTNPLAGGFSPFTLRVTREDGEQNVSRIDATLPRGVLAKLAGVPLCEGAAAAFGNCPASSQVGTTTVGAGAGSNPLYVPQPGKAPTAVYLAGPYKGAPLSLVVKVPAQAGPFDLGTVAVRNALNIDPVTAQASVSSDPLPQIIQGIPIAYRDVRVEVDRPDFTLNPTSCDPMSVDGVITSAQGKSANVDSRFQVANCERLAFKPSLALKLSGPTHRSAYPALKATLTMPKGGANIQRAAVTLPKTEILEQAHIKTICTRVQYAANACPKGSIYGYAKAWSPLLDKPLQGPVYLRSSSHPLPDLVASLDGQIHIDLQGRIDSKNARIRNTFDLVPDAPVSKFVLTMQGGKKGLLVNNTELCRAKPRADALFDAQNGKVSDSRPLAKVDCGKGRKK